MNSLYKYFLILFLLPITTMANSLSCPAYAGDKENILTGVSVFNAASISDKTIYELAPDKEISKNHFITQYWIYLNQDSNLKSFFSCIYKNNNKSKNITLEIPSQIHQCQFNFKYNPKIIGNNAMNGVTQARFTCKIRSHPNPSFPPAQE